MAQDLIVPVIEVYDADTIKIQLTLPAPLNEVSVRLLHIDSPEVPAKSYAISGKLGRAKCEKEAQLAIEAREYLKSLISANGNLLYLTDYKYGTYGGRILANVFVYNKITEKFINLADRLKFYHFAVPYDGKSKRSHNWCE